jgi:hypothetical protein
MVPIYIWLIRKLIRKREEKNTTGEKQKEGRPLIRAVMGVSLIPH